MLQCSKHYLFITPMKIPSIFILIIISLCACTPAPPDYQTITGQTMGTSYHITYKAPQGLSANTIQNSIDERLAQINASMSTYDNTSTISKFNHLPAGQNITIDGDFIRVLHDSRAIHEQSGGAFDPTVYPLVELWGFGAQMSVARLHSPPSDAEIATARTQVGLDKVVLKGEQLSKTTDGVGLDFSAIAKGYGVDVVANTLRNKYQITDFMVEIGGEIATQGVNNKGKPWTLAIDKPILGSTVTSRQIATTISSPTGAPLYIATSGNYRNMIEHNGIIYSHTISPITARPVTNGAASVSVIADSVALADGWATALSAMSFDEAIAMANNKGIKALFIKTTTTNTDLIIKSKAYQQYFGEY